MIFDKIYQWLPNPLQNIGISLYGLYWKRRRFSKVYFEEIKLFKDREYYTTEQWRAYQEIELKKLVYHAINTTEYYKRTLKQGSLTDIASFPFLEKSDLKKYGETDLISKAKEEGSVFFSSSGTTGTPTKILFSKTMHQRWSAVFETRIRNWAGVSIHIPRGMIGGRRVLPKAKNTPPYYRYNFFEKQTYFSAYHISGDTAPNYLEGIKKNKVEYMTGYAMSNYFLARFFDELKLDIPPMKAVITSSEKLTEEMRETFKKVYGCKTYDSWSGVEACGLFSECEEGNLHSSPDVAIIEILDENGNECKPGVVGEVVCTGLLNFAQPLIRYRIGDMAAWGTEPCKCGRSMPVIQKIEGRVEDTVVGSDGREMVRFHGVFIGLPNILQGQIVQESLTVFTINLVVIHPVTQAELDSIKHRMISQLGTVEIKFNVVTEIPATVNGKFKAVISKIKR